MGWRTEAMARAMIPFLLVQVSLYLVQRQLQVSHPDPLLAAFGQEGTNFSAYSTWPRGARQLDAS